MEPGFERSSYSECMMMSFHDWQLFSKSHYFEERIQKGLSFAWYCSGNVNSEVGISKFYTGETCLPKEVLPGSTGLRSLLIRRARFQAQDFGTGSLALNLHF